MLSGRRTASCIVWGACVVGASKATSAAAGVSDIGTVMNIASSSVLAILTRRVKRSAILRTKDLGSRTDDDCNSATDDDRRCRGDPSEAMRRSSSDVRS